VSSPVQVKLHIGRRNNSKTLKRSFSKDKPTHTDKNASVCLAKIPSFERKVNYHPVWPLVF